MNKNDLKVRNNLIYGSRTLAILFTFAVSLLPCLLFLTGCDQTFQPLQENNAAAFSMFGYLDASADRQTVRITPLQ